MFARVPPRLRRLHSSEPLYFVTACTHKREALLANDSAHAAFVEYAQRSKESEIAVGGYVLMPDHIHFFVRVCGECSLGTWMGGLKQKIARGASIPRPAWQRGFFDHVLRSDESYSQKWEYVRMNPVRAGLVTIPEDWPFSGEIEFIDRA
jgi:REP element-mobilizing transposase RayT